LTPPAVFPFFRHAQGSSPPTPRQARQINLLGLRQRARLSEKQYPAQTWPPHRLELADFVSGSFIDPEFAATSSDLLFTAKIDGHPAFLYILFEDQNQEDPLIGLRLLTYMVRIWNEYFRNNPGATKLPPILPLVLAQDNKPWKTSTRFADLIDIPQGAGEEIKKHIPDFEFQLVELFRMPYEKILGTPMGILTLRALKAEKLQALLDDTVWDESLLIQLPSASFEMLMRYILDRDLDKPAFRRRLKPESGF
jgi:hypothetical protein